MNPTPYLFFNGTCAEAMAFYAETLGAEIEASMRASEMPGDFPVPDERKDWIMHGMLRIGEGHLMMSDNIMGTSSSMDGASVMLSYPTRDEAHRVFSALSDEGAVTMPFETSFWSAGFGTLTDRYGIRWMIGCDEPPG
jgi:PhnB protein